jgi:hypothetical protein
MSILDLNSKDEVVTPAKAEVKYPLNYATKILLEGDITVMRAYVELTPYRRIYADREFEVAPAQPIVDAEGQPVLDENGFPTYTPAVTETRNVLVGEELMPRTAEGFNVKTLNVPNILPANPTPDGKALVEGFLMQYLQAGGDLAALVMAGMVVLINQVGVAQGVLAQE